MQKNVNRVVASREFVSDVLLHLTIALSSWKDFPHKMENALQTIGEFSSHDRIMIVEVNRSMSYTIQYEWHEKALQPLKEGLKHNRLIYDRPLEEQLCTQNYVILKAGAENVHPDMKKLLEDQECRQMLVLPLFEANSEFAFILFMQCREEHAWDEAEIAILGDLASVIAVQLDNYQMMRQLLYLLKKTRKEHEQGKILHKRLLNFHKELKPSWESFKGTVGEGFDEQGRSLMLHLDRHMDTLEKICHAIPIK